MSLRILIYAQHLSGVGHYVRTFEIARALASHHQVYWVEGGRPVPHVPCPQLNTVELPRIRRAPDGRLQGLDRDQDNDALMRKRASRLLDAVMSIRPQIFLVEYFPFSKWELTDELLPAIDAVRRGGGQVLCSLRDVVRKTRFETTSNATYAARVTQLLNRYFDALLVHADPVMTRLEEHFPAIKDIRLPIHYTGIISEKLAASPDTDAEISRITEGHPFTLLSTGGGTGGRRLKEHFAKAWQDPAIAAGRLLVICAGLGWASDEHGALIRWVNTGRILTLPFRADFLNWLARAEISISQCGYNTAANVLETGTPAIVCPDPNMSDQSFRAERMAALGLVTLLDPDRATAEEVTAMMDQALQGSAVPHRLKLDGAERTRALIEACG